MLTAVHKSKISILLPDSVLSNEDTMLLKTRKIGIIARIVTIFRIGTVFFYRDTGSERDRLFLKEITDYISFPPYLRKYIPQSKNLRYAAILPPIQSPNHIGTIHNNKFYFSGIVHDPQSQKSLIDIGKSNLIEIENSSKLKDKEIIIVGTSDQEKFQQATLPPEIFWSTQFKILTTRLEEFLSAHPNTYTISASKSGTIITSDLLHHFKEIQTPNLFLAFGPIKGSFKEYVKNSTSIDLWINMIPNQGAKTVKIEEALHSALTLMNIISFDI